MESSKIENMVIKIKEYKVRRADRGMTICLPAVWTDDLGLKPGDILELYRDEADRLILVKKATA